MAPRTPSPVWHPFTQHALAPEPPLVDKAEGAWLVTPEGRRILDAISSWWVTTHGHNHPSIMAAIRRQTERLDQAIFANFTHQPAEDVARELIRIAPKGDSPALAHVFYSDSGSTAVEVALKMALGFWRNVSEGRGTPRSRILALEHAYHGDTIGTMSAGARGLFNAAYAPLLFDVERIPFPDRRSKEGPLATLAALEKAAPGAAALIVEPLLLGAGGMLMYDPQILRQMKNICSRHGVLFIADEVLTGFGRTGTLFACQQAGIAPDILCLAKGLTGGALPLAATLATPAIFAAHYSPDRRKTFFHSSSYTANPIACAAARENLRIWAQEPVTERIAALGAMQEECLGRLGSDPRFTEARRCGTVTAMDLKVSDPGYLAARGPALMAALLERNVLLRPLGNTLYVMPPYCIGAAELHMIYDVIGACV